MSKYSVIQNNISADFEDQTVLLNVEKGEYFGLNEVGTFVWKILEKDSTSLEELVHSTVKNFAVEENQCRADIEVLIQNLLDEKLIEKTN